MKRDAGDGIEWVWPLFFWQKCQSCGKEFRRERGWARWTGKYPVDCRIFLCLDCAPTRERAQKLFRSVVMKDPHYEGWASNYRKAFGCADPGKKECNCKVCQKLEEIYDGWVKLSQTVMETYHKHIFSKEKPIKEYKTFGTRESPIPGEW